MFQLELIIAPIASFLFVQVLKRVIERQRGLPVRPLTETYGGMPSSHAAFVSTLVTLVGFREGVTSAAFAIAMVFSLVILTDAIFFRRHLESYGRVLERLVRRLPNEELTNLPTFTTRLGHSFAEVIIGVIVGALVAFFVHWLI